MTCKLRRSITLSASLHKTPQQLAALRLYRISVRASPNSADNTDLTPKTVFCHPYITISRKPLRILSSCEYRMRMSDTNDNNNNDSNNNSAQLKDSETERSDEDVESKLHDTVDATDTTPIPYSMYTSRDRNLLMVLSACIGLWSLISMPIYFPLLPVIQKKFNISDTMMNLAVVLYLIFQGLGPTVVGNLADVYGRRPMLIVSLIGYIGANIGLAVADAYWLILFLRCIQAASIAPVIALSSGIVGDITRREDRGSFMGVVAGIQLVGQGFGALIGAALASSFGWRAIFWFLAICGGAVLIIAGILLPETRRTIAGNGSVKPTRLINKAPILLTPYFKHNILLNQRESLEPQSAAKFNILQPLIILWYPEVATCLFSVAILFTTWTLALTLFTSILSDGYHYGTMKVGLCYLPSGIGCLVGALTSGKVLDIAYRLEKRRYDKLYGDSEQKPDFNIIRARCSLYYYPASIFSLMILVFGWTLDKQVNIAAPLVMSFFAASLCMFPMTMAQTVLVDMFPTKSSTSTSVLNLTRCLTGAIFVAVLSKMFVAMTIGGAFTFFAGLCMLSNLLIYALVKKGKDWVRNREQKERLKEDGKTLAQQQEEKM